MIKLKNISIKKYLQLPEQLRFRYDLAFEYVKPNNRFNKKQCNLESLTFDEVSAVKKIMAHPQESTIKLLFEICYKEKNFLKCKIFDYFQSKKYLDDEVLKMVKREKKMLFRIPDKNTAKVNTESLNVLGEWNTKIELGEMFGLKPSKIGKWKYKEVLIIQSRISKVSNIQSQMK